MLVTISLPFSSPQESSCFYSFPHHSQESVLSFHFRNHSQVPLGFWPTFVPFPLIFPLVCGTIPVQVHTWPSPSFQHTPCDVTFQTLRSSGTPIVTFRTKDTEEVCGVWCVCTIDVPTKTTAFLPLSIWGANNKATLHSQPLLSTHIKQPTFHSCTQQFKDNWPRKG